jgi:hypothetical protein
VKALALILAGTALAVPAPAQARAKVDVMVAGRDALLAGPQRVVLKSRSARVAGRRCAIGARTPLSALAGTGLPFRLTDYGACSRRPRDAGSLYVRRIASEAARGSDGWVYKVGNRAGSAGAADPGGSFGDGRLLRAGQRVLWFWCVKDAADSCQRTLAVTPARSAAAPGATVAVTVRGYDDGGAGVRVAGATVRLGAATATTGADGVATLPAPGAAGRYRVTAQKPGLVRSFPARVVVG